MADNQTIDVSAWINERRIGGRQWLIIMLCACVALLDAVDVQAIGLAAPGIQAELKIPPQNFGALFSAAMGGLAVGSFFLGPLADKVGRKRVLVGSTLAFGLFTIATALASSFPELLIFRFCAGLGLGGAMPSFISLATEYVPRSQRSGYASLVWSGFPVGGVVGGLLGAHLIPQFGWRSIFWVGGIAPIVLALALIVFLPESVAWLITNGARANKVATIVRWLFPDRQIGDNVTFQFAAHAERRGHVSDLFTDHRTLGTLCLWVANFFIFMVLAANSSWTPLLLKAHGITIQQSSFAIVIYNFGSVFGSAVAGYLMMRFWPKAVLLVSILGGALSYASVGWLAPDYNSIFWAEGLVGLLVGCGSSGLIALGAIYYPSRVRSTGIGWATGLGRMGAFSGPLFIQFLVTLGADAATIFSIIGAGASLSGFICLILRLPARTADNTSGKAASA